MKKFGILLIGFLFLVGCSVAEHPQNTSGDIIVTGSIGDASNLLPLLASDKTSHDIASLVYNGLVKYDKDVKIVGDLARSWEVSQDGLTITFFLRDDVRWHDGVPFTANDVLFTYQLTIDPQTPTAYSGDFLKVKTARVIDNHTFQVTYGAPFAPALMSWGSAILPRHLLEGQNITETPLARNPVGTGPFKFKEWIGTEKIVLVANPDYFGGKSKLSAFVMRVIPDPATMFLQLRSGGIDLMRLTPMQFSRQTDTVAFRRDFNKCRYPAFSYTYLGFNLASPTFSDRRVRRAIAHAINKREIIDGVMLGLAQEATGPYPTSSWAYNPRVTKYEYSPQKARKLLASAGWSDTNGDGILDKEGKAFEIEIITNQGNDVRAKTAEIIQRRLLEVGIVVKIRIVEWAAFVKDFIGKRRFDVVILGWSVPFDPDNYDIWHSHKTGPNELNFVSFKNAEVDKLLEAGRNTFNTELRKRYYWRFQEILAEEVPYIFLYVPDELIALQSRFQGVLPAKLGIEYNLHEWFVAAEQRRYVFAP
ncbi:MAG: peptide-binding protein [Deltaproteobacteria bacterium]|nr:peptide-binding protein [Deltaproteobacteria bacterium]